MAQEEHEKKTIPFWEKLSWIATVLAFVFSAVTYFDTKSSVENKIVETLSERYGIVDKEMSYEQALEAVDREIVKLQNDNSVLQSENIDLQEKLESQQNDLGQQQKILSEKQAMLDEQQKQLDEDEKLLNDKESKLLEQESELGDLRFQIEQFNSQEQLNKIIKDAASYRNNKEFVQAITILKGVENKTSEIQILINEYSQEYESFIIEQVDALKKKGDLDEADVILTNACLFLSDSQGLKEKQKEIQNSYPQKMLGVVPAYQSGGYIYKEYMHSQSGGTSYFMMGGVKYTDGMTIIADNHAGYSTWVVYNLDGKYNYLDFILCHIDGARNGNTTSFQVFYDSELKEEILLTPDMAPTNISLEIKNVKQLKFQITSLDYESGYGIGNPMIR